MNEKEALESECMFMSRKEHKIEESCQAESEEGPPKTQVRFAKKAKETECSENKERYVER